jgi:hypothetical protein
MARAPKTAEAAPVAAVEPAKQPRFKFKKDDPVRRVDGSTYSFPGLVVAAYRELNGQPRYVVACTAKAAYNLQHIFNGDQLEKIEG